MKITECDVGIIGEVLPDCLDLAKFWFKDSFPKEEDGRTLAMVPESVQLGITEHSTPPFDVWNKKILDNEDRKELSKFNINLQCLTDHNDYCDVIGLKYVCTVIYNEHPGSEYFNHLPLGYQKWIQSFFDRDRFENRFIDNAIKWAEHQMAKEAAPKHTWINFFRWFKHE